MRTLRSNYHAFLATCAGLLLYSCAEKRADTLFVSLPSDETRITFANQLTQSPDFNEGRPIWSTGFYREIVPLERIVCTDSFADEDGNIVPATDYGMADDFPLEMVVTVTFEDLGGRTRMTLRHEGMPAGEMSEGASVGWNESFDKLAESLRSPRE